ncbi:uncharacterized protein LOC110876743 [Helianthus annuus]|uniref:uncharacterized protein LOC110876743 n=1 Tax=Helianthus annuus TaxID=4232 RepID=UPI001652E6D9|nr:uncharacterized protein LOC110876743 [Helianthus annuus]
MWKARHLSFTGRMALAKAVLGSLPSYFLLLFSAPKCVLNKLEKIRRNFIWGKTGSGHKIRWVRWAFLVQSKRKGGLGMGGGGIMDFNLAMLTKWCWRFKKDPNHLWARVVTAIHKTRRVEKLIPCNKSVPGVWKDIGKTDADLLKFGIKMDEKLVAKLGDGANIKFWKDSWLLDRPLKDAFSDIFSLAKFKDISVKANAVQVGDTLQWRWDWIRDPTSVSEWMQVGDLMRLLGQVAFNGSVDVWRWRSEVGVPFSTKQVRGDILNAVSGGGGFFWNYWAPSKCNFLAWRATRGFIASKEGLVHRGVPLPDTLCARCGLEVETPDHIFLNCLWAKSIWWNMLAWMRISFPTECNNLMDLFDAIKECPGSKVWKRIVHVVSLATVWRIWGARNSKTFEDTFIPISKTVDLIKEDAFFWISNRARLKAPSWENWKFFNVADLL